MISQNLARKVIPAVFIVVFGVIFRIFLNEKVGIPNFEAVTALSLLSGVFLGGIYSAIVPLFIIFLSDIYFGNTSILFFTWSAFAAIGIFGWLLRKRKAFNSSFVFKMTGAGVFSALFFYLYTNFGWWFLTNMYSHDWQGLISCYIMGLPFFKTNLLGNLFFVPLFTSLALLVEKYCPVLASKFRKTTKSAQPSWIN